MQPCLLRSMGHRPKRPTGRRCPRSGIRILLASRPSARGRTLSAAAEHGGSVWQRRRVIWDRICRRRTCSSSRLRGIPSPRTPRSANLLQRQDVRSSFLQPVTDPGSIPVHAADGDICDSHGRVPPQRTRRRSSHTANSHTHRSRNQRDYDTVENSQRRMSGSCSSPTASGGRLSSQSLDGSTISSARSAG